MRILFTKKINTIVLGDPLAEGNCQDIQNNIPGHLIKKGFSTLNLGVIGTSVLVPIGIMREFGEITRPKILFICMQNKMIWMDLIGPKG